MFFSDTKFQSKSVAHGVYKVFKTKGKRGKEGKLKRPPHHGDTGIAGVTTRRLTGGNIFHCHSPTRLLKYSIATAVVIIELENLPEKEHDCARII